jgi:hypothetical protein
VQQQQLVVASEQRTQQQLVLALLQHMQQQHLVMAVLPQTQQQLVLALLQHTQQQQRQLLAVLPQTKQQLVLALLRHTHTAAAGFWHSYSRGSSGCVGIATADPAGIGIAAAPAAAAEVCRLLRCCATAFSPASTLAHCMPAQSDSAPT